MLYSIVDEAEKTAKAARKPNWKSPEKHTKESDVLDVFFFLQAKKMDYANRKYAAAAEMASMVPQILPGRGQPAPKTVMNFLDKEASGANARLALLDGERKTETGGIFMETEKRGELILALQTFAEYMDSVAAVAQQTAEERKKEADKRKRLKDR